MYKNNSSELQIENISLQFESKKLSNLTLSNPKDFILVEDGQKTKIMTQVKPLQKGLFGIGHEKTNRESFHFGYIDKPLFLVVQAIDEAQKQNTRLQTEILKATTKQDKEFLKTKLIHRISYEYIDKCTKKGGGLKGDFSGAVNNTQNSVPPKRSCQTKLSYTPGAF